MKITVRQLRRIIREHLGACELQLLQDGMAGDDCEVAYKEDPEAEAAKIAQYTAASAKVPKIGIQFGDDPLDPTGPDDDDDEDLGVLEEIFCF